ncbi:MAG: hypothetical protein IT322_04300 [Anaerolineae bacterium]|nr:hypothetical protein [Anaerolineae bacterium]CAG0945878.1 hypothetical protein ANRL1_02612 [Anaerolineae bacterium]
MNFDPGPFAALLALLFGLVFGGVGMPVLLLLLPAMLVGLNNAFAPSIFGKF